jgi:DNA polymerase III gamma/tau subunit
VNSLFENVVGHQPVKKRLSKILQSGNIPHAFLFSGEKGVGKFLFALEIVKYLNLQKNISPASLKQIENLRKPYIDYIFPLPTGKNEKSSDSPYDKLDDNQIEEIRAELKKKIENPYHEIKIKKAQDIKISSIRELKKSLSVDKSEIPYNAVIIDNAERMNDKAQNSLLKSLEEPPEGTLFFLLVSDENLILETIKSRAWYVNFSFLKKPELEEILIKYTDYSPELIHKITPFVNGSVTKAEQILEYGDEIIGMVIDFIRQSVAGNTYSASVAFDSLNELTNNNPEFVIEMITMWLSDAAKEKITNDENSDEYYFSEDKNTFIRFNKSLPDAEIFSAIKRLNELAGYIKNNVSLKIILMNIIFVLHSLSRR